MKYDAVLFDMDGTLIKVGHLWNKATRIGLEKCSIVLTEAELNSLAGKLLRDLLTEKGYSHEEIERVRDARDLLLHPLLKQEAEWYDGALELLDSLKEEKTAIVTGSHASIIDTVHRVFQMRDRVGTIVWEEHVKKMKPDPEGLFIACTTLGVDPIKCVYIGDQWSDQGAAANAGMDFILKRSEYTPADLQHEREIQSLRELFSIL